MEGVPVRPVRLRITLPHPCQKPYPEHEAVQPSTALGALRRRLPEGAPGARARARRRRARREEGALAFWKGNSANVVRIFPYSAAQLMSNDYYKRLLAPPVRRAPPPAQASAAPP